MQADEAATEDVLTGLHATLRWRPCHYSPGDGSKVRGWRREDGMGYALPDVDGRWWATWAHPMLCGRPGWHHHALGTYPDATAAAFAFDKVYDLELQVGNVDRCPELRERKDG